MPDSDGSDLVDSQPSVLADVNSESVTDDGQVDGSAPPEGAVEELRAVAEELREERERLEWTASQVAHLVDHRSAPSVDPDPTPPAPIDLQAVAAPVAPDAGQVEAAEGPEVDGAETIDPDDAVPASRRRGGRLVTVLGVVMLILAAAVLMSRAVA